MHWSKIYPLLLGKMEFCFLKSISFLDGKQKLKSPSPPSSPRTKESTLKYDVFIWSAKMIFFFLYSLTERWHFLDYRLLLISWDFPKNMIYALVITLLPVQYDRYFLRFSYFTDLFHEPVGEWYDSKIWKTRKILAILYETNLHQLAYR